MSLSGCGLLVGLSLLCATVTPARITRAVLMQKIQVLSESQESMRRDIDEIKSQLTGLQRSGGSSSGSASGSASGEEMISLSSLPPCPRPTQGFHYHHQSNACYNLQPKDVMVNFTAAAAICQALSSSAHLVSIKSEMQQKFLERMWRSERGIASVSRFWTSAQGVAGRWTWYQNTPVSYQNWIPTTLHSDDRYSCMAVYSNEAYYWGDVACWAPHLVTCQISL